MRYFCVSAALLLSVSQTQGASYSIETFGDVQYSDNINQRIGIPAIGADEESGSISTGGVRLTWANDPGTDIILSANGSYGRRVYSSDELDPETLKDATVNFLYDPSGSNFRFSLFDTLRQVATDRTSLQTNNNTSDVNVLTAIPSYYISFSSITRLEMNYSFSRVKSDQEQTNRDINGATVGLRRAFRGGSSASFNVSNTEVDFAETDRGYEVRAAFFRFDHRDGPTTYVLDLGRQEAVDLDDATENLIALSLSREINSYGQFSIGYQNGFVGATNVDVNNSILELSVNEFAGFVQGLTTQEQISFNHIYQRDQWNWGYTLYRNDFESVEDTALFGGVDETRKGVAASGGYQFTILGGANLNAGIAINLNYEEAEFNLEDLENESKTAQIRFSYRRSRDLQLFLQFQAREGANLATQADLDERTATFGVSYTPFRKE